MEHNNKQYLLVFRSNNQATYFCNLLYNQGIRVELISTPGQIASSCSKSIKFSESYLDKITEEMKKYNFSIIGMYKIEIRGMYYRYIAI